MWFEKLLVRDFRILVPHAGVVADTTIALAYRSENLSIISNAWIQNARFLIMILISAPKTLHSCPTEVKVFRLHVDQEAQR